MPGIKKTPMRQCVGCGEMKSKRELLRIIRTPEGEILLDTTGRKNGRGAYLCPDEACLGFSRKKKSLERALKSEISEEVYRQLEDGIRTARSSFTGK